VASSRSVEPAGGASTVSAQPADHPISDPLPGLRKQLADEYGDSVPADTIDLVARQSLGEFQAARIRDFVPVFAWRRARRRLRDART
jgi:hypothetical protein